MSFALNSRVVLKPPAHVCPKSWQLFCHVQRELVSSRDPSLSLTTDFLCGVACTHTAMVSSAVVVHVHDHFEPRFLSSRLSVRCHDSGDHCFHATVNVNRFHLVRLEPLVKRTTTNQELRLNPNRRQRISSPANPCTTALQPQPRFRSSGHKSAQGVAPKLSLPRPGPPSSCASPGLAFRMC